MKPEQQRTDLRLAVAPITNVNVRDASGTGDGSWTMEGYAAVYEQATTLYDIPGWLRVDEEIARGALTDVIARANTGGELVHLNHGHDMKTAVAATDVDGIGGLELGDDFHGMRWHARVDPEDPDALRMAVKMRRGVVKQGSFAFTIGAEEIAEQEELDDGTLRIKYRITEVSHLYDVCVCAQGAYAQTESYIRSLAAASLRIPDLGTLDGRAGMPAGLAGRSPLEGRAQVAPDPGGSARETPDGPAALIRAQVDAAHSHRTRSYDR